jgi:hypothetical protein
VTLMMGAAGLAIAYGPPSTAVWMVIVSVGAAAFAVQSVVSDPADLTLAMLLCAAPILTLLGEGAPGWLIGPLAVMLLVGGELNALSWASQGGEALGVVGRRRLAASLRLAGTALVAALGVTALGELWVSGRGVVFVVGVAGLAGLAAVVFRAPATPP